MQDTELNDLEFLRNGSSQSFEHLYFHFSAKLYNFVLRLSGGNKFMTEELVQRTFIKVWENRRQIDPEKSFLSYLCTIAKNMLINEYEHQTIKYIHEEFIKKHVSDFEQSFENELETKLLDEYIEKLTAQLPPKRREIFILSRRKGLTNKEIAKQLEISESTIETQLSKALSFMKNELKAHFGVLIALLYDSLVK